MLADCAAIKLPHLGCHVAAESARPAHTVVLTPLRSGPTPSAARRLPLRSRPSRSSKLRRGAEQRLDPCGLAQLARFFVFYFFSNDYVPLHSTSPPHSPLPPSLPMLVFARLLTLFTLGSLQCDVRRARSNLDPARFQHRPTRLAPLGPRAHRARRPIPPSPFRLPHFARTLCTTPRIAFAGVPTPGDLRSATRPRTPLRGSSTVLTPRARTSRTSPVRRRAVPPAPDISQCGPRARSAADARPTANALALALAPDATRPVVA
ncbi:hypothetical protein C8R44DRAFT_990381 [Mycena epipterygia]|nr:hypothetical protein C8R44DRAFT_990381 [Mycena epipterygia]